MPPDVVKQKKVTFAQSLPMGTRGTFTHDGELWIAYPSTKNQRINSLIDRMLGSHKRIMNELVRWLNAWPDDAERVTRVLEIIGSAVQLHDEVLHEKGKVLTS